MIRCRGSILFLGVLALCLSSTDVSGCSCITPGPPSEAFEQATAVFVGKVIEIELMDAKNKIRGPFAGKLVQFSVERAFKGVEEHQVQILTARSEASCGYPFEEGKIYLVYANKGEDERLRTSICSRTQPLSRAHEDLKFLRSLSPDSF